MINNKIIDLIYEKRGIKMNKDKIIDDLLGIKFNERKVAETFGKSLFIRIIGNAEECLYFIYEEIKIDEPICILQISKGLITKVVFKK